MKRLAIDIETYSPVDLKKSGVYVYSEHSEFEILLFAFAWDDGPVEIIDLAQGERLPENILNALTDTNILKTAFNAPFELTCISNYFGLCLDPSQWSCTAVMSRWLGLPASLESVGEAISLKKELAKDKSGKALINYFSKPCRPTKANGQRTRNLPHHAPEKWDQYKAYNMQDVEAERAVRQVLERFTTENNKERAMWLLDQKINNLGVRVHLGLARNAKHFDDVNKAKLLKEAQALTKLDNPKSNTQLKNWMSEKLGHEVKSLNKKELPEIIKLSVKAPDVLKALTYRAQLSKTSTEKFTAMQNATCRDGRARGLSLYYGASRTGRWAGRLIQMQNLPQNKLSEQDLDLARELVKSSDLELFTALFSGSSEVLSQLIRTAFIPRDGYEFIVADFSAIEARVIAWLANEAWRLEVFNTHGKIYEASAEQMFKLPPGSVKKGSGERTKGKIAELALGYGGSIGALKSMGALQMGLSEVELKPLVDAWRQANKTIVEFWWDADRAIKKVITKKAPVIFGQIVKLKAFKNGPLLHIELPSGRLLSYVAPKLDRDDNITYLGNKGLREETYGPKIVENIVQATARDCLAEALLNLDRENIDVVFHVHDEVICEVPKGKYKPEDICEIITRPLAWARDLNLKAEAYICDYYKKD